MNNNDFTTWATLMQQRVEAALEHYLPRPDLAPQRLHQAMHYAVFSGGKRIRPQLSYATAHLNQGLPHVVDRVACAVEMMHCYSLVHDDLPCMDNDQLRRGHPTCHVQYDEATALLVGDSLQTQAFLLLAQSSPDTRIEQQIQWIRILADASGSSGMAGGQALDMAYTQQPIDIAALENMHQRKTGALIRAAILMGASCGTPLPPEQHEILSTNAERIGLLFQIVDDILDATQSTQILGKTAGKDLGQEKATYVTLLGLATARERAENLYTQAQAGLRQLAGDTQRLEQLLQFICHRIH
jgi:farnesyl diphosphate synthase